MQGGGGGGGYRGVHTSHVHILYVTCVVLQLLTCG